MEYFEDLEKSNRFLHYVQLEHPAMWESLLRAQGMGLIHIDEENDAITATNRLLLTYPDLHEVLNVITESWVKEKSAKIGQDIFQTLLSKRNENE